jgi:hypothetical protein
MEKIPIKVKVDDIVSINLEIPREMDIFEFVGLVEKLKPFTKATQAASINDLRQQPPAMEAPDKHEEFLREYKQYPLETRFEMVGKKYGYTSQRSMEQSYYYLRQKVKKATRAAKYQQTTKKKFISDANRAKIVTMYERGGTAGNIGQVLNLDAKKVANYINFMKLKGSIKKRIKLVQSNIANPKDRTSKDRQQITDDYKRCTTTAERNSVADKYNIQHRSLAKIISGWRIKKMVK